MGPQVSTKLERAGFFPAGGGRFAVDITPVTKLRSLDLRERGESKSRAARAIISNLSPGGANRELKVVSEKLGWGRECLEIEEVESNGPGNALLLELAFENITEVFTGFGERGVLAETVAENVSREVRAYLAAGVPVGEHLADQLLLPMALGGGGSFLTSELSGHTRTNSDVISRFLSADFRMEQSERGYLVSLD